MLLDARLARMFCVMAEELHFGRAAKRMFISQPPLSQAIRQLEHDLEAQLFVRTTRSVKLTRAGQLLYDELQQMEHQTGHIRSRLRAIAMGMRGVVRIGVTPSGLYSNFSTVLRYFREHHPDIDLNVTESSTEIMNDKVRRGQLDIGLMRPLAPMPGVSTQVVYREPLRVAMRMNHALADKMIVTGQDMQGMSLITYDPLRSPYFHYLSTQWLDRHNVAARHVQGGLLPTILALVDGEMGLAIVPSVFAQFKSFGLHYAALENADAYLAELSVAWRSDETDPLVMSVIETLLENRTLFAGSGLA